jgi:hypothetical protein
MTFLGHVLSRGPVCREISPMTGCTALWASGPLATMLFLVLMGDVSPSLLPPWRESRTNWTTRSRQEPAVWAGSIGGKLGMRGSTDCSHTYYEVVPACQMGTAAVKFRLQPGVVCPNIDMKPSCCTAGRQTRPTATARFNGVGTH